MAVSFCCPLCRADVQAAPDKYTCVKCRTAYPIVCGIPDFRPMSDDGDREKEYAKVRALEEEANSFPNFGAFMKSYIPRYNAPSMVQTEFEYELKWEERGREMLERIERLAESKNWGFDKSGAYLDIGCGKGAMLGTLAPVAKEAVGLEYVLRYCVMGKRLLKDLNMKNISIVCGSAANIPFKDGSFDFATGIDIIEHLSDQEGGLREMGRVLKPGGHLFLTSPNRYNALMPESHVGVFFVGFMPRKVMPRFIRLFTKAPYDGVWLISLAKLRRLLRLLTGEFVIDGIMILGNPTGGIKRILRSRQWIIKAFNAVLFPFIPTYNVLFRKGRQ